MSQSVRVCLCDGAMFHSYSLGSAGSYHHMQACQNLARLCQVNLFRAERHDHDPVFRTLGAWHAAPSHNQVREK